MGSITWGAEIAEVYDEAYAARFAPSVLGPMVGLLAGLAGGGPALEFAVGTGRVALPLSARGIAVRGRSRGFSPSIPVAGTGRRSPPKAAARSWCPGNCRKSRAGHGPRRERGSPITAVAGHSRRPPHRGRAASRLSVQPQSDAPLWLFHLHDRGHAPCVDRISTMTSPGKSRRVEVKDGNQTVAAAEVTTSEHAEGTVRTSLFPSSGHRPPGSRASLVDAVMDLPEVQAGSRLEATVPLGDSESLERLRERTQDAATRPAGSTALVDADIPPGSPTGTSHQPGGQTSAW